MKPLKRYEFKMKRLLRLTEAVKTFCHIYNGPEQFLNHVNHFKTFLTG